MTRASLPTIIRLPLLTLTALLAFAGNSVLCRLALKDSAIDAVGFTLLRLFSGALFLVILLALSQRRKTDTARLSNEGAALSGWRSGNWLSGVALFVYAAAFSFAYITMDTGAGALVLFGFVQLSMIIISFAQGQRLSSPEWIGLLLAFSGLAYLLLPGAEAPEPAGFLLMAASGVGWGIYTLRGRSSVNPLADTTGNFLRATLPAMVLAAFVFSDLSMTIEGAFLGVASGALASGAGYAIWYSVLKHLKVSQAAVLQLAVPVIAALGGLLFANEAITGRFVTAALLVLGGISLVILSRGAARPG